MMNLPPRAVAAILLSIVFVPVSYGQADSAEETPIEARFVAKVQWIEQIGKRQATVIPIGFDIRWLVGIRILSIEKAAPKFDQKCEMILAVHSPSVLLSHPWKETLGKSFAFTVTGHLRDGRPEYNYAEGRLVP